MKKIILVLMGLFLFYQAADAAKYYCPENPNSNFYSSGDVYNTENDCSTWNSDFFKRNSPDLYPKCISNQKTLENRYNQGKCQPITVKTHNFGNATGKVEVVESQKRVISKSCSGGNGCMEKLNQMYSNWK